ncbi:uncharacterized protein LOC111621009 isoform X1 [Centruroides sculpturatus]|uniref:uncharacterized protein LOC111621009 isoform X1 n=2 Tax=Centruroides sculpturatus TaxID=218467 RepID=UPI000C6E04A4|nr:uncharacterized protein LOC111621009 isoform X1 [Centruroides sculpturatus]
MKAIYFDKTAPGTITCDLFMQTKNVNHDLQQAAQNAGGNSDNATSSNWKNGFPRTEKVDTSIVAQGRCAGQPDLSNSQYSPRPLLPPKPSSGPPPYRAPPYPFGASNGLRHSLVTRGRCPSPAPPETSELSKNGQEAELGSSSSSTTTQAASAGRLIDSNPTSLGISKLSQGFKFCQNGDLEQNCNDSEIPTCRTQAWIEEQKTTFKSVSSLQQRIKSFLHPSTTSNVRKTDRPQQEAESDKLLLPSVSKGDGVDNPALATSVSDVRITETDIPGSITDKHETGGQIINVSGGGCRSRQGTTSSNDNEDGRILRQNIVESNENSSNVLDKVITNSVDTQNLCWSDYLMSRTNYENMSHNMTTTYNYDKILPKSSIGKSNQDDKNSPYKHLPYCAAARLQEKEIKDQPSIASSEGPYHSVRNLRCYQERINEVENKIKTQEGYFQPDILRDSTDTSSEQYKSSSESGRGTMHSGIMGSKSPTGAKSSGPSTVDSILDSSLDSDQSTNGNRKSHKLEAVVKANAIVNLQTDGTCSESFSITPPLPPLSPPHTPEIGRCLSPESKYHHSMSSTMLNPSNIEQGGQDYIKKSTISDSRQDISSSSKNRKSMSSTSQSPTKLWEMRNKPCTRSGMCSSYRQGMIGANLSNQSGHCTKSGRLSPRVRSSKISLGPIYAESVDADMTSTTTGLDMDSLLDEPDDYSSECSATTSNLDNTEVAVIRKQLEGLELMYSEILRILGVKPTNCNATNSRTSSELFRPSRRRVYGSLSSLTGRSSVSRGTHSFRDKRGYTDRRKSKDSKSCASKRLQRLESHVITLARSIAHLSSEMRTQQMLIQELDSLRRDVGWVQEQLQLVRLSSSGGTTTENHVRSSKGHHSTSQSKDWDRLRKEILELISPGRVQKLTKFFGDEPPLLRQFLKKLGYEKYAPQFELEKIGIMELPYLTEDRLQKIGIPMGPRMRILQEAQMSFRQDQLKIYIV